MLVQIISAETTNRSSVPEHSSPTHSLRALRVECKHQIFVWLLSECLRSDVFHWPQTARVLIRAVWLMAASEAADQWNLPLSGETTTLCVWLKWLTEKVLFCGRVHVTSVFPFSPGCSSGHVCFNRHKLVWFNPFILLKWPWARHQIPTSTQPWLLTSFPFCDFSLYFDWLWPFW